MVTTPQRRRGRAVGEVADTVGSALRRTVDRGPRWLIIELVDAAIAACAWLVLYTARFDFDVPPQERGQLWASLAIVVVIQATANHFIGLARGVWSASGIGDMQRIVRAALLAAGGYIPTLLVVFSLGGVPRSVLVLSPMAIATVYGFARIFYRATLARPNGARRAVSVVAVGDHGTIPGLAAELSARSDMTLIGIVDVSSTFAGRSINGVGASGGIDNVADLLKAGATDVVMALSAQDAQLARFVAATCTDLDIALHFLPPQRSRKLGQPMLSELRELRLEDLLERNPESVLEDASVRRSLRGRCVIVTGGGGSIGFELVRQIAAFGPRRLVLFELSEFNMYRALETLDAEYPHLDVVAVLGDVADETLVERTFAAERPDVVFHAAAYKHVPILEAQTVAAVKTNVFGTLSVAEAAHRHSVDRFVLISSDKAVRPSSAMGCTKRLAEMVLGALNSASDTTFMSVRFGNVLDSSGSVVPKFREQIEAGGPVTVTHPDITRYFMTIPEACELILHGLAVGDKDDILVLDMGQPIRIMDLAKQMIQLAGRSRDEIEIEVTGLRPGEKLYEELFYDHESHLATSHQRILRTSHTAVDSAWLAYTLDAFDRLVERRDEVGVCRLLGAHRSSMADPAQAGVIDIRTARAGLTEVREMTH